MANERPTGRFEAFGPEQTDQTIGARFAKQVQRAPDRVALQTPDEDLTYRQIDLASNRIARAILRASGGGFPTRVAPFFDQTASMLTAMIGVLKSGHAYVPLDPEYPDARIRSMLRDARTEIILTDASCAERARSLADEINVRINIDEVDEVDDPVDSPASSDSLAYLLYTSGSTGKPKAVMQNHRNVLGQIRSYTNGLRIHPEDRLTLLSSYTFDAAVMDIYGALLNGATLCAMPARQLLLTDLRAWLCEQDVTVYHSTPSTFRYVFGGAVPGELPTGIRLVVLGGEEVRPDDVALFRQHFSESCLLANLYGMSESSVATLHFMDHEASYHGERVPIGLPVDGTEIVLLDHDGNEVDGSGEIGIHSRHLALGYWDRRELSASVFGNGVDGKDRVRLYRTGDIGRWRADGSLEFLGRKDSQVKVRGYRIEPGEIEAVLSSLEIVRTAAVVAWPGDSGDLRLAVYVEPEPGVAARIGDLRRGLRERLPSYMLPAAFVMLNSLPLNRHGKIDRRALPEPDWSRPELDVGYVEPRTDLERELAALWQTALGVAKVGVLDSFFDLGGDSLQAAVLVNELQGRLGEVVYVNALFEAPTVARLAEYLEKHYPLAVCGLKGQAAPRNRETNGITVAEGDRIDSRKLAELRRLIIPPLPLPASGAGPEPKNAPAVFVLCAPRSGSTLLRVMLAGNPNLFAPPELALLFFNTLRERTTESSGRYAHMLEGTIRALMEIHDCDADEAKRIMEKYEDQGSTVREFYRLLQDRIGDRVLVDKTAAYSHDLAVLRRAEEYFQNTRYVHLIRHPCAVIRSFHEARLDRIFRFEHPFTSRELGEMLWQLSQENILRFLEDVPPHRRHRVYFEELVKDPRSVLEGICEFLGIELHPDMLDPYTQQQHRMTDGLYSASRAIGDVKFHQHKKVDAEVADRWKADIEPKSLGDSTRQLARSFGYEDVPAPLDTDSFTRTGKAAGHVAQPLSLAQRRLWFIEKLRPGSSAYHLPEALLIDGELDGAALRRSFTELVRRHESLRTTFGVVDDQLVQIVASTVDVEFGYERLEGAGDRETDAQRFLHDELDRPFDLERGPLFRVRLLETGDRQHLLVYNMHHIISDGWSKELLWRELGGLYEAFAAGRPSPLTELPIQYSEFAAWQRQRLQGGVLEAQLTYWRKQLAGLETLQLLTDHPRPAVPSLTGAVESLVLPERTNRAIRTLCTEQQVTVFMLLLAAFKALLHRYTGQDDIVVGSPVAGRNLKEVEGLIGFFVNLLVLRTDLSGDPSGRELISHVRDVALGAMQHSEVPFEKLVEQLAPERDQSRNPLFQVTFLHRRRQQSALRLGGASVRRPKVDRPTTRFDLEARVFEDPSGITLEFTYSTDLYEPATVKRLLSHFQALLEEIVADPDAAVSRLPLLSASERRQLVEKWNDTATDYPRDASIHELFADRVVANPDAIALVFGEQKVTYAELDRRANRLAHHLRALGVEHETLVGLCVERSVEMVVGILGILKAGGAYVPLDPSYPASRLALMLEDTQASLLLTQQGLADSLPDFDGTTVFLDTDWPTIAGRPATAPASEAAADSLAYIIYTSGSTGRPKGVCVEHRSVVRLVKNTNYVELSSHDRIAQAANASFDAATFEIWGALLTGARLVGVAQDVALSPHRFAEAIREEGITVLFVTTALFNQLAVQAPGCFKPLRYLLFGGEAVDPAPVRAVLAHDPPENLLHVYGPTENTTFSTWYPVQEVPDDARTVPIGRPIANSTYYVLDRDLSPTPDGVAGELYVGGDGLALGYFNRPELTQERFLPSPFHDDDSTRLYRTGDVVRRLPDGNIEFIGRVDQQVKIRGFRIELGEIETALLHHPLVREAAVLCHGDAAGEKRLVAYVVPAESTDPGDEDLTVALRTSLAETLPGYMVPAAFALLEALPLTANGKLDRTALSAVECVEEGSKEAFVAPGTPTEQRVAEIWADLFETRGVSIHDDFFRLGGHSLMAMRVISRLHADFDVELPVQSLFAAPTIAGMAKAVDVLRWAATNSGDGDVDPDHEDFEL